MPTARSEAQGRRAIGTFMMQTELIIAKTEDGTLADKVMEKMEQIYDKLRRGEKPAPLEKHLINRLQDLVQS